MLSTEFPFDVFISYGGENRAFARRLAGWLRNIQVKVWLDEEQLVPGCRWRDSLKQGLRDSRHLVAVLTPEYVSRPWTQRELDLFDLSADHAQRRLLALEMGQVPESPLDQMFEVTQRIKWQNADFDLEAFWCLSCGLRNCAPSPRNTWAERGKALLSEVHPQQIYGEPLEPVDYFLFYEPTLVAHRNIIQMAFAHAQGSYSNLQSCVSEVRDLIKSEDRNNYRI